MVSHVCALGLLLAFAGAVRANESSSKHYSNISLNGGAAAASSAAPPARMPPAPSRPPDAPAASPGFTALRPWIALASLALLSVSLRLRSRETKRDRAAGETLALAAHELKSPLTAIESYLDLMTLETPQGAHDTRLWLEDIQRMKSTTTHLRRTISDILDMTGIDDGRIKLEPRPVPLAPLLSAVAAEHEGYARARGVRLSIEAPEGAISARADPDRLRQVLHNLIGNALKFTPSGRCVVVRAGGGGANATVSVRDEGAGVPPEKAGQLFGKFARLSPSLDGSEGTGLGLYISRRLIEAQGGRLTYAPAPQGGSIFEFTLPRAEAGARIENHV